MKRAVPVFSPVSLCVLAFVLSPGQCRGGDMLRVTEDGRPRAAVIVHPESSEQVRAAAALLVHYVNESTGATLPLYVGEPPQPAPVEIRILSLPEGARVQGGPQPDADGFTLRAVPAGKIIISGGGDWGTEFGVIEFLERYVGVRWLLPGPDGVDVPKHATLDVPCEIFRQEPAFFSRQISGLRGEAQGVWARRNRLHSRVSFHHNLINVFPPETFTQTHPEFFPIKGGKRFLPETNKTHGWQPCFSEPATSATTSRRIPRPRPSPSEPTTPADTASANDAKRRKGPRGISSTCATCRTCITVGATKSSRAY